MSHAAEKLEHAHHVGHSAGHGGHDAGPLSMRVGITMAILGVVLAFAAAKVGGERAELVQALVDQQHANANYQAQDIKHRVSILTLQNLHAEAEVGKTGAKDMLGMAESARRYEEEAALAYEWTNSYDVEIETLAEGQESYERGQLAAELGIVVASIALLLRRREAWFASIALGVVSVVLIGITYQHVHHTVEEEHDKSAELEAKFEEMHEHLGAMADADHALVEEVLRSYGGAGSAAAPTGAPRPPAAP